MPKGLDSEDPGEQRSDTRVGNSPYCKQLLPWKFAHGVTTRKSVEVLVVQEGQQLARTTPTLCMVIQWSLPPAASFLLADITRSNFDGSSFSLTYAWINISQREDWISFPRNQTSK